MKLKVMAVDDEPEILNLLKGMLEGKGCEVISIGDSREAVDRLQEEKFDGLFVDVVMPYIDGFALTRSVRASKLNRQVPIVMLTAMDDAVTMRKGFAVGISFFLGKPFTRERVYNLFGATRGLMFREKQRYIRLPYRTTVACSWGSYEEGHFKSGSKDISEGGMLLSPSGGIQLGHDIVLRFTLPDTTHSLKVEARVVRVVPPDGVGLSFKTLSERDKKAIMHYVAERTKDD